MTGIVTILYNPAEADIAHLALLAERYEGVIVDNSPTECLHASTLGRMAYLFNDGENLGIAAAQNKHISLTSSSSTRTVGWVSTIPMPSPTNMSR